MEADLYDYPRESIERRKLMRQLRRACLGSECIAHSADDIGVQTELYQSGLTVEHDVATMSDQGHAAA